MDIGLMQKMAVKELAMTVVQMRIGLKKQDHVAEAINTFPTNTVVLELLNGYLINVV